MGTWPTETAWDLESRYSKSFNEMETYLAERLPTMSFDLLAAGAAAGLNIDGSLRAARVQSSFDKTNKLAQEAARKHAAKLVKDITGESRKAVRDVITKGFSEQIPVKTIAQQLTQIIGMNSVQAKAHARQFPDPTTSEAQKAAKAAVRRRALNIARTETIRASNEGQRQLWLQRIAEGKLPNTVLRKWVITPDEKLCPICAALAETVAGVSEPFDDGLMGPPAHPQCRCTTSLVISPDPFIEDHFKEVTSPHVTANVEAAKVVLDQSLMGMKAQFSGLSKLQLSKLELVDSPSLPNAAKPGQVGLFSPSHDAVMIAVNKLSAVEGALTVGPEHWSTNGGSIIGVAKHELGHKLYYKTVVKNKSNQGEWKAITSDHTLALKVSKYAQTSPGELFSESFAAYTHKDYVKGTLPKPIEDFMAKVVGVKKGGVVTPVPHVPAALPVAHVPSVSTPTIKPLVPQAPALPGALPLAQPYGPNVPDPKFFDTLLSNKVGAQAGSNPGGVYQMPNGDKYYVKFYSNPAQGVNEHLANVIYKGIGAEVPETLVGKDSSGKQVFASKWRTDLQGTAQSLGLSPAHADKVMNGFIGDVFTKNWDAVGLSKDNIGILKSGEVIRLDNGGSLLYRAQGSPKAISSLHTIDEWETFFNNAKNPAYSSVAAKAGFNSAEEMGHQRLDAQLQKVKSLVGKFDKLDDWQTYVDNAAPTLDLEQRKQIAAMLHARVQALDAKVASLAPIKPQVVPSTQPPTTPESGGATVTPHGPDVHVPAGKKDWSQAEVDYIVKLKNQGYSSSHIASTYGVDPSEIDKVYTVGKHVSAVPPPAVAPAPPKPTAPDAAHLAKLHKDGYSINELAYTYNISPNEVQYLIDFAPATTVSAPHVPTSKPIVQAPPIPSEAAPQPVGGKKFVENDVAWMKKLYSEGKTVAEIAKQFGSSNTTVVYNIVKEKTWKHVSASPVGPMPVYGAAPAKAPSGPAVPVSKPTPVPAVAANVISKIGNDQYDKVIAKLKANPFYPASSISQEHKLTYEDSIALKKYIKVKFGLNTPGGIGAADSAAYQKGVEAESKPGSEILSVRKKYNDYVANLPSEQSKAITRYTGGSGDINGYLRGSEGSTASSAILQKQADNINAAMRAAPKPPPPTIVYRRSSADQAFIQQLQPGVEMNFKGYQSTAVDGFVFSGNLEFEIINPKAGIFIQSISSFKAEREYLLPNNAKYRVIKILESNAKTHGTTRIRIEMLDNGDL